MARLRSLPPPAEGTEADPGDGPVTVSAPAAGGRARVVLVVLLDVEADVAGPEHAGTVTVSLIKVTSPFSARTRPARAAISMRPDEPRIAMIPPDRANK